MKTKLERTQECKNTTENILEIKRKKGYFKNIFLKRNQKDSRESDERILKVG